MPEEQPIRIHCFAHAGAGVSSFRPWTAHLGPGAETVGHLLPGREHRRREPRITSREGLLAELMPRFAADGDVPYVFYGHSLGALVAYTVTRALHEAGLPGPALLALGASPPPDAPAGLSDAGRASDEDLLRLLDRMGAVPEGARPGGVWHRSVLPVLRDDLLLAHDLRAAARRPSPAGPLGVPVLAVAGQADPVAGPEALAGWREWTTGPFTLRTVRGDHFFLRGHDLPGLLGRASRVVARLAPRRVPAGV
ncbi:thioesterase II family protein [Streptomyces monashensis]|uniref:Thioesterase n=1 Tax=Streptomyces monashensis TaxID=1678012 RepID=A0A1S2QK14_9ACTN|nr:thioesterase domain-containing protein [Streptomyces monashensis]OIK06003.1 thioesterase [Streptomyces monashensis]